MKSQLAAVPDKLKSVLPVPLTTDHRPVVPTAKAEALTGVVFLPQVAAPVISAPALAVGLALTVTLVDAVLTQPLAAVPVTV